MDTRLYRHATSLSPKHEVKHASSVRETTKCGVRHVYLPAKSKNDSYARVTFASDRLPLRLPHSGEAAWPGLTRRFLAALGPVSGMAVAYSARPATAKNPAILRLRHSRRRPGSS